MNSPMFTRPIFGNTIAEENENLTVLLLVAIATAIWFSWKMMTREQSWLKMKLAYYLSAFFGIKGGQLRNPLTAVKPKKKVVQRKKRPSKKEVDETLDHDVLTLLMTRFPNVSMFYAQTKECQEFLDETIARLEQPNSQAGLAGVQTWLSCNVKWGPFGSDRGAWCDIADNLKKLRCTAASSFAKWAMSYAPEVQKREVFVGQCQFMLKCNDRSEVEMINGFFKEEGTTPSYFLVDNIMYHECIVKVVRYEKRAFVWDYGVEYDAPNSTKAGLSIIAFKFNVECPFEEVHFGNFDVPTNKWFTTCPEVQHNMIVPVLRPHLTQHQNKKHIDLYGLRMQTKAENHQFTVFISATAMNNGNPCPGVGLARCLRRSFGNRVRLVGFEYSLASGGIRDPVFDDCCVIKQFYGKKPFVKNEVFARVKRTLEESPNSYFISAFDVEIDLLVKAKIEFAGEEWVDRILIPTEEVLDSTEKPHIHVIQKHFGMVPPEFVTVEDDVDDDELKEFFIEHGPQVLAKGAKFGCSAVKTVAQARCAHKCFVKKWGVGMFLQKPIHGYERSYMFAAYKGKLLGAIEMRKDITTAEGKCWGVHLEPLSAKIMADLRRMCAETKWTGGGEIEFMVDMAGKRYCTDFNPRFPAWVFGGCHGGINLPGLLLQEITGIATDDVTSPTLGGDFIRSVIEVPVCNKVAQPVFLAGPDLTGCNGTVVSKASFSAINLSDNEVAASRSHPSRFGEIAQLSRDDIYDDEEDSCVDLEEKAEEVAPKKGAHETEVFPDEDVWVFDPEDLNTNNIGLDSSTFMMDEHTLRATIDSITEFTEQINIDTIVGLSVKTQPHDLVLQCAKEAGWYSECIAQAEVQKSIDLGFPVNEIIVNGPLKNWPEQLPTTGLKAWFADSLEDFDQLIATTPAEFVGFRMTPHNVNSRFGVPIEKWREMKKRLAALPETQKIGMHFHFAQTKIGSKAWFAMARGVVRMIPMISPRVQLLDFGGGWIPGQLVKHVDPMNELVEFAKERCPLVETVVFEPGKSVTQAAGGFVTKVHMIREGCGQQRDGKKMGEFIGKGAIVDGFIGDLGVYGLHKHPVFYHSRITPENESVIVRSGVEADIGFLVESITSATAWEDTAEISSLLDTNFFHFSKWTVAELDGEAIGCVFAIDADNLELEFETTHPLGAMVADTILSDRNGLHLLCLEASNPVAYSSLLKVILKSSMELNRNTVYVVQSTRNVAVDQFRFQICSEGEDSQFTVLSRQHWKLLQPGKDKILGRICMEFDQFGNITLPEDLRVGDHILIRECGAYDMTMSYLFGDAKQRDMAVI